MKKIIHKIDHLIYLIRGQRVMLDEDLAEIYCVETKVLNQAIRRNMERFPEDFMFQLNGKEYNSLRSQIVTSKRGGRRYMPFMFTEHGAVMLASVLRSKQATLMSIEVVRAFVRFSKILTSQKGLAMQISEIRSFLLKRSNKTDSEFKKVWRAIEELAKPIDTKSKRSIGFRLD